MSAKHSPARKRAFLTYLAQTGNQTLSAERACVSGKWVLRTRSSDPAFDAAYKAAIAEADARFGRPGKDERPCSSPHPSVAAQRVPSPAEGGGESERPCSSPHPAHAKRESPSPVNGRGSCAPPANWRYFEGAELVVAGSNRRHAQVRRARPNQFTPRAERRFLSALASTCNVQAACAQVGRAVSSANGHRRRWPAFAEAWRKAEETGYVRIEAAVLAAGCNLFSQLEFEPEIAIEGMTIWHALQVLYMHRHQVRGIGGRPGAPPNLLASDEEVVKALTRSLRAFGVDVEAELAKDELMRPAD